MCVPGENGGIIHGYVSLPEGNMEHNLGGGFKYFLFSTLSGEMIQFD